VNPFDKKRSFFPDWCKRKLASVKNRVVVLTTAVPFVKSAAQAASQCTVLKRYYKGKKLLISEFCTTCYNFNFGKPKNTAPDLDGGEPAAVTWWEAPCVDTKCLGRG